MFKSTIKTPKTETNDKGKREVPVVEFDDHGTTCIPNVDTTPEFYLFSGKTAEDVTNGKKRIRATNFSLYYGKYEVSEDEQVPIGFKVTLEPIYEEVKKQKPATLPRKLGRK